MLRLGYYKLTREKKVADDWVWIVDHTVQVGPEKCLLILGVRLSHLPAVGSSLAHEDVEVIDLLPVKGSDGETVYQQLEEATTKTGVPREIVSDHAPDLSKGLGKFSLKHPETAVVYDIKHKTAAVLKRELEGELKWEEFIKQANRTKVSLQQTALAHLTPPPQRSKGRYMSAGEIIEWGQKVLEYLASPSAVEAESERQQLEEKLGWIREYREELGEWSQMMELVVRAEKFVREKGLYQESHHWLEKELKVRVATDRTQRMKEELVRFVQAESQQAKPGERLVGSSEVIESVLGKFKRMEDAQAKSGVTGMLLALGAMVSETSVEVVKKAMESVKTRKVLEWCAEKLGKTVQAKRRAFFKKGSKAEQKLDQLKVPA